MLSDCKLAQAYRDNTMPALRKPKVNEKPTLPLELELLLGIGPLVEHMDIYIGNYLIHYFQRCSISDPTSWQINCFERFDI